jgi:hypothetical protein
MSAEDKATVLVQLALGEGRWSCSTTTPGWGTCRWPLAGTARPTGSTAFREWLARLFFQTTQEAASGTVLHTAVTTLEGHAKFDGPLTPVHVRLAGVNYTPREGWF